MKLLDFVVEDLALELGIFKFLEPPRCRSNTSAAIAVGEISRDDDLRSRYIYRSLVGVVDVKRTGLLDSSLFEGAPASSFNHCWLRI